MECLPPNHIKFDFLGEARVWVMGKPDGRVWVGCCDSCSIPLRTPPLAPDPTCLTRPPSNVPGKDSIRYENTVDVDPKVFQNLQLFSREDANGKGEHGADRVPRVLAEAEPVMTTVKRGLTT